MRMQRYLAKLHFHFGETLQLLKARLGQHKCHINNKNIDHSSLVEHAVEHYGTKLKYYKKRK